MNVFYYCSHPTSLLNKLQNVLTWPNKGGCIVCIGWMGTTIQLFKEGSTERLGQPLRVRIQSKGRGSLNLLIYSSSRYFAKNPALDPCTIWKNFTLLKYKQELNFK